MEVRLNGRVYTCLEQLREQADEELFLFLEEWFDDRSYVLGHTSGSTGAPKEIQLSKADMRASARTTNAFFAIDRESVLLLCLSVSYIAGKMMVVRALEAGAELLTVKVSSHPLRITGQEEYVDRRIDLAAMVPMQVEESMKSESEKQRFGYIRHLIIGGAPVSVALEERLKKIPTQCYATYGMTETVSHIALKKLNSDPAYFGLGEVGFEQDERGCLIINAPHLQARRFVTNDMVRLHGNKRFEWLGRFDYVINSGGIKLFPELIEQKLVRSIPGRFFITSRPDEVLGESVLLALEGAHWDFVSLQLLLQKIRPLLGRFELPKAFVVSPFFRETTSGKVVRTLPENAVFYPVHQLRVSE